jgi:hypothetical protein
MDGTEQYPVRGHLLSAAQAKELMGRCRGLLLNWDCIAKAKLVKDYVGHGVVFLGSCEAITRGGQSAYGHHFNPPLELHAWWQPRRNSKARIDIALPGLILKGLNTADEQGPFLEGREPFILAGVAPWWVKYKPYETLR